MQPCSRETQAMNSLFNPSQQIQLQDLRINGHDPHFETPTSSHDDFLEQMLSTTSFSASSSLWSDLTATAGFHHDEILGSNLSQQQQINVGDGSSINSFQAMKMMMMMQQQMMVAGLRTATGGGQGSMQTLFNGFGDGSFHHPQASFRADSTTEINQNQGPTAAVPLLEKPKQKVRARRGQATDPHSIAERRVRIAERMKALQEMDPNANKIKLRCSMRSSIMSNSYRLQLQAKVLSLSRLGGAAAVAPLVTDMRSEGGGDCIQTSANGGSLPRNSNGEQMPSPNDNLTVSEQQVVKLMEENMGSAMQLLQGKGLCLMPISLATAISSALLIRGTQ